MLSSISPRLALRILLALGTGGAVVAVACSSNDAGSSGGSGDGGTDAAPGTGSSGASSGSANGSSSSGASSGTSSGATPDGGLPSTTDGGLPAGWLFTDGGSIYVSNGAAAPTQWMGRGVNIDDIYFCGYDNTLWMTSPGQTLETVISGLLSGWKPSFVRISLGMDSDPVVTSWVAGDAGQYKTPMIGAIEAIGSHAGTYVLVTLRSDASMIGQDEVDGDPEATGIPSDSTTTPDASAFPTGTDATYQALVDSFATDSYVLFGLTNEPGGNKATNATLAAAMSHAVGVIRAEEDKLGVPHHLVSVQGNSWTSDISFYSTTPLPYDNVVYEVHGYPPAPSSYTYANIPVIVGEYGSLTDAGAFFDDVEAKHVPNLAWDFDSYSDCAPDLLTVNQSDTNLQPSAWGAIVQQYLLAHAP